MIVIYNRAGRTWQADTAKLPPAAIDYLLQNGFSQSLQDAFVGPAAKAKKEGEGQTTIDALIVASIEKRHDAILAGTVGARVGLGRDPVRTVAKEMLEAWAKANGFKLPKEKDKLAPLIDKWLSKHQAEVIAEVEARKATKLQEIDADDLESLME
jgi:hypothetical protein